MKKYFFGFGLLLLLGAGCSTPPDADNQPTVANNFVTINWSYDAFLDQICLDGGSQNISATLAEKIEYPDQATDHLCISNNTSGLLSDQPAVDQKGSAEAELGNLKLISSEQGRIYSIDVLKVK